MKKFKYLVILVVLLLSVGCGSNDGSKILEDALENMKDVKNGSIVVEMNVAMDGYAIKMNVYNDFLENGNSYSRTEAEILGMSLVTESYVVIDENLVYTYITEDGENWTYTTIDKDNYAAEDLSMTNIGSLTENYKSVKQVKSDRDGHKKLEVIVDHNKIMENLLVNQEYGSDANFEITEDLKMYVYVKDGYITGLNLDFSDVLNSEDNSMTNYSMNFTISNHNKLDEIQIDEEIIKNATLKEPE